MDGLFALPVRGVVTSAEGMFPLLLCAPRLPASHAACNHVVRIGVSRVLETVIISTGEAQQFIQVGRSSGFCYVSIC